MSTHAEMIEDFAQELAEWLGEDFRDIAMIDHYLAQVEPVNPRAAEIAGKVAEMMSPVLEQLRTASVDNALKDHQLASCNAEFRNLADYIRAIPSRMPKVGSQHAQGELLAWLEREIKAAPTGRSTRARR
ncbi:hypothetical protein QSV36_03675 [Pseudomonas sp. BCRC 81390]|uniref:hypothetical protein n=1 Tax=Pseudomonas sp. BCRC 81390 TaxID=3054778 RepID=UPI0025989078|nr:hypothetical protein [Pseudomonas sp. BCRC 81390]MDM3884698.1 hypothetical protein [Pseudomonas sp. BCRC 81390]